MNALDPDFCKRTLGHCWKPIAMVSTQADEQGFPTTYDDPDRVECRHCKTEGRREIVPKEAT